MKTIITRILMTIIFLTGCVPVVQSQSCGCTITIDKEGIHDGKVLGVKAGDVVCVKAGKYNRLRFVNFAGTTASPILIKNCGGQVMIEHSEYWSGMEFYNCKCVRASGTGSSSYQYGFKINVLSADPNGVAIGELSTNFELDHIEVMKAGFAGVVAKTDPRCDLSANRGNFTMNDISIHDNYIHDTGGEGFYIGHSFYSGFTATDANCKGTVLYPHDIHKLRVYNNITDRTGCEGIQVGCATNDVEIYNNRVSNYGMSPFALYQNNGIQLSEGTTGKLYNNFIINGTDTAVNRSTAAGIIMFPYGGNYIYNNVVVNFMTSGIMVDNRAGTIKNSLIFIGNNTFVTKNNVNSEGLRIYSELTNNKVYNNVFAGSQYDVKYLTSTVLAEEKNNLHYPLIKDAKFVDVMKNNYQLTSSSPCVDAGLSTSAWGVTSDYLQQKRPTGKAYDVGAYEYTVVAGVDDVQQGGIHVYPNPATDFLMVDLSGVSEADDYQIGIYDLYGRKVFEQQLHDVITSVSIAHLPAQFYVLKCCSKKGCDHFSLIKR